MGRLASVSVWDEVTHTHTHTRKINHKVGYFYYIDHKNDLLFVIKWNVYTWHTVWCLMFVYTMRKEATNENNHYHEWIHTDTHTHTSQTLETLK